MSDECPEVTTGSIAARENREATLLADLVAKYLASDGSHGLYDARTMIEVREQIVPAIISRERIAQEREKILSRIVG